MYIDRQTDREEDKAVREDNGLCWQSLSVGCSQSPTHCTPLLEKGGGAERTLSERRRASPAESGPADLLSKRMPWKTAAYSNLE